MTDNFETQYNKTAKEFNDFYLNQEAHQSTDAFFNCVSMDIINTLPNKNVLDLGCGAGADADFYIKQRLRYFGIDASEEMVALALNNHNVSNVRNETFSQRMSYADKQFGLIVSKYAIQTAEHIAPIYEEVHRMLDDRGYFIFLVVHPLRQFLEKKKQGKDYFKKEIVGSVIFGGKIIVSEPTHTLTEYLSADFLNKFSLLSIKEGMDFPNSEQINGDVYPTYLIITAQKKG